MTTCCPQCGRPTVTFARRLGLCVPWPRVVCPRCGTRLRYERRGFRRWATALVVTAGLAAWVGLDARFGGLRIPFAGALGAAAAAFLRRFARLPVRRWAG